MTTYGWVTLEEAETYMATRLGAEQVWVSGAAKTAALQTAYNMLSKGGRFKGLPTTPTDSMKEAQFEHTLFLLQQGEAVDLRAGVIAQGVNTSWLANEQYDKSARGSIPVAPLAAALLADYDTQLSGAYGAVDIERDDDLEN